MVQAHHPGDSALTAAAITGVLDWWRDAGVDLDFHDTPTVWLPASAAGGPAAPLARPATAPPAAEPPPATPLGGDPATHPATLGDFQAWWLTEPALDDGQVRDRVPPRGPAGADLMIIVSQPEAEDGASLLSGREGRLIAGLLGAAGIEPAQVYFASALPR
ncbi:MAG TPA: hypothetical protein VI199_08390, partial [Novosphingobium sp.]